MNKLTLVDIVAEKGNMKKKDAEIVVNALFAAIEKELVEGGKVQISGFGAFKVKERAARMGRNPKTLEPIEIPASRTPIFSASQALKDSVNG